MRYLQSHLIPVSGLELALVLPVHIQAIRGPDQKFLDPNLDPKRHDFLHEWVQKLTAQGQPWHEILDGYPKQSGSEAGPSYSEFCYFHPFVRNFLYVTRDDIREKAKSHPELTGSNLVSQSPNRNLRVLERNDLKKWVVEYGMDSDGTGKFNNFESHFDIHSTWMYLFDTQIALLGIRLQHTKTNVLKEETINPLSLRQVLKIQDVIRRVYSPYWSVFESRRDDQKKKHHHDSHVPTRIKIIRKNNGSDEVVEARFGNFETSGSSVHQLSQANFDSLPEPEANLQGQAAKEHIDYVFHNREPFTVDVWKELLRPLCPTEHSSQAKLCFPLRFEHVQDERAMLMSHISIAAPKTQDHKADEEKSRELLRSISPGDWIRLAFVDDPGHSSTYPYSPEFMDKVNPLQGVAYDRFWHSTGKAPGQDHFHSTRWLCSGYGFTGVGNGLDHQFFNDEHAGALCHFRHHYFALGLIALFHRASLLTYKHRLAESSDAMLTKNDWNTNWLQNNREGIERLREIDFRNGAEQLAKEFMRFRTLYWFCEVSNQIQGSELFAMYRKHLNLDKIFTDVVADVDASTNLLRQWDNEETARATQLLGILGAIMLVFSPLVSSLSSLVSDHKLCGLGSTALVILGLVILFQRCPSYFLRKTPNAWWGKDLITKNARRLVRMPAWIKTIIGGVLVMTGLAGIIVAWSPEKPKDETKPANQVSVSENSTTQNARSSVTLPEVKTDVQPKVIAADQEEDDQVGDSAPKQTENTPATTNQPSPSSSTSSDSGSNVNAADAAPQNPKSGSEPPNQAPGEEGDTPASDSTNHPAP